VDINGNVQWLDSEEVFIDYLPVELTSWDAIPGDASVELRWVTAFEEGIDEYRIDREGETLAFVQPANSDTGYSYSWTDTNVVNTIAYSYVLSAAMLDGSVEVLAHHVQANPHAPWPGDFGWFSATPADGAVWLNWWTGHEYDGLDHFEIERDGVVVYTVDSAHSPFHFGDSYDWIDSSVVNGVTYGYLLVAVGTDQTRFDLAYREQTPEGSDAFGDDPYPIALPETVTLHGNYPNPFNPATTIEFSLAKAAQVELKVYDLLGREVAGLLNEPRRPGRHNVEWNASSQAAGVYLAVLRAGGEQHAAKMILLK
jgi:hypothetical protein